MKYFEVTFTTSPCNEIVNDVVSALAGEIGFESFVEWDKGVQAYIQQQLFDEKALEEMVENFPLSDTRTLLVLLSAFATFGWVLNSLHPRIIFCEFFVAYLIIMKRMAWRFSGFPPPQ